MNDHILNDPNVIDYICGELSSDTQPPELTADGTRFKDLADLLPTASVKEVSETFDERLQQKLNLESRPKKPVTKRWPALSAAAAVAAILIVLFSSSPNGGASSIVWADVVQALDRAPHFHTTALIENPRNADESRRLFKLELYYRAPDQWRAQGLGHVQFLNGKQTRMFDATKRQFVDRVSTGIRLIPDEFVNQYNQGDLLGAVLYMLFRGKPPQGQPVKSDMIDSAQGIEVFDYAHDATKQWARIWVLKQSHLPLKIKIFEPRSNNFTLVTFDYSDPQPVSYFNPDQFEKVIKDSRLQQPYQILRAGMSPINGKPTNRGQVHELQGDYKPARILDTAGNGDGAFMVTHTDPDNMRPEGGNLDEKVYEMPTDNWRNIYFSSGAFKPVEGNWQRFYAPVSPFKRGRGERIITLTYAIELHLTVKGGYRNIYRILSEEHVRIDMDSAAKVSTKHQQKYWSKEAFDRIYVKHMRVTAPATVQWQYVQTQLKDRPDDVTLLLWAYKLQMKHDRKPQARQIMADHISPRFMADPAKSRQMVWDLGEYLKWLYEKDGLEALAPIIVRLKDAREQVRNTKDKQLRHRTEWLLEDSAYGVNWITDLPSKLVTFKRAPKPKVLDIVRGRDKLFVLRVRLPRNPMNVGARYGNDVWRPQLTASDQWRTLTSDYDHKTEIYSWLIEPLTTQIDAVPLEFKPFILGRPFRGGQTIQIDWSMTVDLPAAVPAESAQKWWSKHVSDRPWRIAATSTYRQLAIRAHEALLKNDYEQVIDLNHQRLKLPKDQWPENYFHPANVHLHRYEKELQDYFHQILIAKLRLGRLAEVLAKVALMENQLSSLDPTNGDYGSAFRDLIRSRAKLRGVRLVAVEILMEQGRPDEAKLMLDDIAKDRPNPLDYPHRLVVILRSNGSTSYVPRSEIQQMWRKFDIVQWNLISQR